MRRFAFIRFLVLSAMGVAAWAGLPFSGGMALAQENPIGLTGPRPHYRVGIDPQYPPYTFVDEADGTPQGFAVDLIRAVAETEQFDVEFVALDWSGLLTALDEGEIDVIANLPAYEGLEERFDLTLSHSQTDDSIFTLDSPAGGFLSTGDDEPGIVSIEDLRGRKVAVLRNDVAHDYLVREGITDRIETADRISDVLRLLPLGEAEAALLPQNAGRQVMAELNLTSINIGRSVDEYRRSLSFAVPPGSPLLPKLEEGLAIITADGRYNQIYEAWLTSIDPLADRRRELLQKLLITVALVLTLIAALSLAWLWSMRRTVTRRTAELRREVAERRRAEEALLASERKYRGLFNSSIDAIVLFDMEGQLIDANPAFSNMLGLDLEELTRQTSHDLTAQHWHDFEERILSEQVIHQGYSREYEKELMAHDGSLLPVSVRSWLVEDEAGEPAGVWCLMRDLSERKEAERQRQELEQQMLKAQKLESLGILAGGIAHDFNNLLMGILGNVGLARLDLSPESPAANRLEDIENAGQRAADLCRQMLAYSGRGRFVVEPIDLSQVVSEMLHLLEATISKKATFDLHLGADLPLIEADPAQIGQVVMNLITNASDALGEGEGTIVVTTGLMDCDPAYLRTTYLPENLAEGRYVFFEVHDTGCGMSAETQARMFDPFFTTKFTGQGLGLAATLGIVRGHRGALRVTSKLGEGTRFRVLFPSPKALAAKPRELPAEKSPVSLRGEGTVLVVDDESMVLTVAERVLQRAGYRVLTASDGDEGVDVFREHADEVSVVLLDMTMRRLDGDEAFRRMRRIRPEVRVILTSGYTEREATRRFADLGLAGFIQKPYPPSALLERIRQAQRGRPAARVAPGE